MTRRADARIHLFSGCYQGGSFASRPGVSMDEAVNHHPEMYQPGGSNRQLFN